MVPRERSKEVPSLRKISSKGSWYRKCGWVGTTSQTCAFEISCVSFGHYCACYDEEQAGCVTFQSQLCMHVCAVMGSRQGA